MIFNYQIYLLCFFCFGEEKIVLSNKLLIFKKLNYNSFLKIILIVMVNKTICLEKKIFWGVGIFCIFIIGRSHVSQQGQVEGCMDEGRGVCRWGCMMVWRNERGDALTYNK